MIGREGREIVLVLDVPHQALVADPIGRPLHAGDSADQRGDFPIPHHLAGYALQPRIVGRFEGLVGGGGLPESPMGEELGGRPLREEVVGHVIVGVDEPGKMYASEITKMVAPGGSGQSAATQVMVSPSITTSPTSTDASGCTIAPLRICLVGSVPFVTARSRLCRCREEQREEQENRDRARARHGDLIRTDSPRRWTIQITEDGTPSGWSRRS